MKWLVLIVAGIFEIGWAVGLKHTDGFSRLWPSVGTIAAMIVSLGLLGIAMKSFELGTAYAIWVGVGVVGTTLCGILMFGETVNAAKLVRVAFIVAGILGLKLNMVS